MLKIKAVRAQGRNAKVFTYLPTDIGTTHGIQGRKYQYKPISVKVGFMFGGLCHFLTFVLVETNLGL